MIYRTWREPGMQNALNGLISSSMAHVLSITLDAGVGISSRAPRLGRT